MQKFYVRVAPSLGALEADHKEIWGTEDYDYKRHRFAPTCFFGLYDARDYLALMRHRGRRFILWAGSDIRNFINGFAFNDGKLRWLSKVFRGLPWLLAEWLEANCENWVENEVEALALAKMGISSIICPSFLGDVNKFKVTYKWNYRPKVYVSSGQNRQLEYGFGIVEEIAIKVPEVDFYLYGADWQTKNSNVIVKGRVPKDQMNEETDKMQAGLRLNEFDGCSEIVVKAALRGQYVISRIKYPTVSHFEDKKKLIGLLKTLPRIKLPNERGRDWFLANLNRYPWNVQVN